MTVIRAGCTLHKRRGATLKVQIKKQLKNLKLTKIYFFCSPSSRALSFRWTVSRNGGPLFLRLLYRPSPGAVQVRRRFCGHLCRELRSLGAMQPDQAAVQLPGAQSGRLPLPERLLPTGRLSLQTWLQTGSTRRLCPSMPENKIPLPE